MSTDDGASVIADALAHGEGCPGRISSMWYNCGMKEIATDIYG